MEHPEVGQIIGVGSNNIGVGVFDSDCVEVPAGSFELVDHFGKLWIGDVDNLESPSGWFPLGVIGH